mgnify:FL=1
MKKAILLHGWAGKWDNHWFPWAKKELEQRGFEVFTPDLPNARFPVLAEQIDSISEEVKNFKKWDIIIGHSLGCQLALRIIHEHKISGIKAIFVWPSFPETSQQLWKDFLWDSYENLVEYNLQADLEFEDFWNEYILCLWENDEFIDLEKAEEYYCMLEDVEILEFPNSGHFNSKSNTFEIPELLEYFE